MQIIPAIDIRGGRCVRLRQGDYSAETIFDEDPVAAAQRWVDAGAQRLHVVDLDGARDGAPANFDLVVAIAQLGPAVQTGGGIRDAATVRRYLEAGLDRVALGTVAVRDAGLVESLAAAYGDAIIVSLDARDGRVATDGWTETSDIEATDLAIRLVASGVHRFVYTDINRDGMMDEPNYESVQRMVEEAGVPVVAAGGVADKSHIRPLAATGAEAVIVGRALYDGRLDLQDAFNEAERAG
ncbi:MAG TPA: 1-(5-phosphoribosyl)-5-[(5-phosphoribosylamino)methylideneamino]imidazole-4-carboxamide isomerase [Dehalococcoidia bacterium]|nr:1-(5-phosphoribosyl)-5-[(5-phosphoribosylamino)methylideneamino]imidazole-4-carboxamide isomerase [Dehalococcoidia bacterium]